MAHGVGDCRTAHAVRLEPPGCRVHNSCGLTAGTKHLEGNQAWQSQFPSLLLEYLWYSYTTDDFRCNIGSVMYVRRSRRGRRGTSAVAWLLSSHPDGSACSVSCGPWPQIRAEARSSAAPGHQHVEGFAGQVLPRSCPVLSQAFHPPGVAPC